ncbi:hypothetical protein WJX81_005380 [Elliptochloris bilobata]|uniref:Ribosome-recycling factor, chloroplastic n=1 Tax=Elliptochloris bilobata TaxID=381761 RepID=A0AAW1QVA1_9CHLO
MLRQRLAGCSTLLDALTRWGGIEGGGVRASCLLQGACFAKGKRKQEAAPPVDNAEPDPLDLKPPERLMDQAVAHLASGLASIRTGRATPGMLDHLRVLAYGEQAPLKSLASVAVREGQTLVVTPFDSETLAAIEAAIRDSPMQLSPRKDGQEVLVHIPRPTREIAAAMAKTVRQECESAKVAVRHARRGALEQAKKLKEKDAKRDFEKQVQKLTDRFVADIDSLGDAKEKELNKLGI